MKGCYSISQTTWTLEIHNQKRKWNRVSIEINFCSFFSKRFLHQYVNNILEKKIALVSLAIIMVVTGVTFGIGFGFQKRPQLLITTTTTPIPTLRTLRTTTPRFHQLSTATYYFKFLKCAICWAIRI